MKRLANCTLVVLVATAFLSQSTSTAVADVATQAPKDGFDLVKDKASGRGFFAHRATFSFSVTDLSARSRMANDINEPVVKETKSETVTSGSVDLNPAVLSEVSGQMDLNNNNLLKRVDEAAPDEFKNIVKNFRGGNIQGANEAADDYVYYMQNLMFEVRELTKIIGAALIRNGIVDPEDWIGVEQYLDYESAMARKETGMGIGPTQDQALKRIVPDTRQQVEVFYFFTLGCSWCRKMAPDLERLYQTLNPDKKVKMVALMLGPQPKAWMDSYREYTGLTMPIMDGTNAAKYFNVGFVPALVVYTPNTKKAYLKTGQQEFASMYQFVRTAQGLSTKITPTMQYWAKQNIGQGEKMEAKAKARSGIENVSAAPSQLPLASTQAIRRF